MRTFLKQRLSIEAVNALIEEMELNVPSRKREKVWFRYALYWEMRKHLKHHSLEKIGNYFGRDHASVLHGINEYQRMIERIKHYPELVEINNYLKMKIFVYGDVELTDLEKQIINCESLIEFKAIQQEILEKLN